jgi:hypothetical protein
MTAETPQFISLFASLELFWRTGSEALSPISRHHANTMESMRNQSTWKPRSCQSRKPRKSRNIKGCWRAPCKVVHVMVRVSKRSRRPRRLYDEKTETTKSGTNCPQAAGGGPAAECVEVGGAGDSSLEVSGAACHRYAISMAAWSARKPSGSRSWNWRTRGSRSFWPKRRWVPWDSLRRYSFMTMSRSYKNRAKP